MWTWPLIIFSPLTPLKVCFYVIERFPRFWSKVWDAFSDVNFQNHLGIVFDIQEMISSIERADSVLTGNRLPLNWSPKLPQTARAWFLKPYFHISSFANTLTQRLILARKNIEWDTGSISFTEYVQSWSCSAIANEWSASCQTCTSVS